MAVGTKPTFSAEQRVAIGVIAGIRGDQLLYVFGHGNGLVGRTQFLISVDGPCPWNPEHLRGKRVRLVIEDDGAVADPATDEYEKIMRRNPSGITDVDVVAFAKAVLVSSGGTKICPCGCECTVTAKVYGLIEAAIQNNRDAPVIALALSLQGHPQMTRVAEKQQAWEAVARLRTATANGTGGVIMTGDDMEAFGRKIRDKMPAIELQSPAEPVQDGSGYMSRPKLF